MEQETKTYFLKNCISFGNENMTKEEEMEIKKGLKNIINNYNSEKSLIELGYLFSEYGIKNVKKVINSSSITETGQVVALKKSEHYKEFNTMLKNYTTSAYPVIIGFSEEMPLDSDRKTRKEKAIFSFDYYFDKNTDIPLVRIHKDDKELARKTKYEEINQAILNGDTKTLQENVEFILKRPVYHYLINMFSLKMPIDTEEIKLYRRKKVD